MSNKSILASLLAVLLGVSALPVYAQEHDQGHGGYQHEDDHRSQPRRDDHHDERGAGPQHAFHRGDRLPPEFRSHQYVVDNWREHHLSAPPRGYHWIQTGGDYVLVAISTGVILQLMFGN